MPHPLLLVLVTVQVQRTRQDKIRLIDTSFAKFLYSKPAYGFGVGVIFITGSVNGA